MVSIWRLLIIMDGKLEVVNKNSSGRSAPSRMTVTLFQDKNGNGIKDGNEPDLSWAGVTIKLTREN